MNVIDGQVVGTRGHALANPGEFRRVIADVLDMPAATVTSVDRLLSEAGLRSKAGRGRGTAHFTTGDAARHLTAIMASAQVKDAVPSVERYSATRLHRPTSTPGAFGGCGIAELEALPKEHNFVEALEALIIWIANGASRADVLSAGMWDGIPIIEVMATTPGTVADIRISGIGGSVLAVRYMLPSPGKSGNARRPGMGLAKREAEIRAHAARSDLEQFRRITGRTLLQVAEVLANDD